MIIQILTAEAAKHLDQLKGGRFPIEVLVRGKDAAENEKLFVTIADKIKEAGVSYLGYSSRTSTYYPVGREVFTSRN